MMEKSINSRDLSGSNKSIEPINYPSDWNIRRKKVYKFAHYSCEFCGAYNVQLNAHHFTKLSEGGDSRLGNLICVCNRCHKVLHPSNRDLRKKYFSELLLIKDKFDLDSEFSFNDFDLYPEFGIDPIIY